MDQWFINPVLAEIGPVKIHWYGVMYAVAFFLGYLYFHRSKHGKSLPLTSDQKDLFLAYVIGGILLGGRIGYILFYNLTYYLQNPLKMFAVWEGGMSFHGGLLGVGLAMFLFMKKHKVRFLVLSDVVTAIAPLGLFFGRIGNFINGELYGRIAPPGHWCLYFPSDPANCRYPSPLFHALLEGFILFWVLFFIRRRTQREGVVTSAFLFFYGVFRIIEEFFREPDPQIGFLPGGITQGQLLSAGMIIASFFVWSIASKAAKRIKK